MSMQNNAARFVKDICAAEDRQLRQQSLQDPQAFIQQAAQQGYHFDLSNLEAQVADLSAEQLAAIWNPGIGPRRHIMRR
jgi:hypothetical protein